MKVFNRDVIRALAERMLSFEEGACMSNDELMDVAMTEAEALTQELEEALFVALKRVATKHRKEAAKLPREFAYKGGILRCPAGPIDDSVWCTVVKPWGGDDGYKKGDEIDLFSEDILMLRKDAAKKAARKAAKKNG